MPLISMVVPDHAQLVVMAMLGVGLLFLLVRQQLELRRVRNLIVHLKHIGYMPPDQPVIPADFQAQVSLVLRNAAYQWLKVRVDESSSTENVRAAWLNFINLCRVFKSYGYQVSENPREYLKPRGKGALPGMPAVLMIVRRSP